ncbi:hypothetical protein D3C76_1662210 [compost metagenome]
MAHIVKRLALRINDVITLQQLALQVRMNQVHSGIHYSNNNVFFPFCNIPAPVGFNGGEIPLIIREQNIVGNRYIRIGLFRCRSIG